MKLVLILVWVGIALFTLLFFITKDLNKTKIREEKQPKTFEEVFTTITLEGCEYYKIHQSYDHYTLTHKGNCKNPIHVYNQGR